MGARFILELISSERNRGCCRLKQGDFLFMWQWREVGHVHVSLRKAGNQAQGLIDALGELYPRFLQTARVNRRHPAQQEWIGDCAACGKNFG